jgi:predicted hotdog family 3-hydroxylacyl-ACP dehydratase
VLSRAGIAARIPHAGRMCLLDRVLAWDERHILCDATNHRDAGHPLRERGGLPVWAGIEYAAQAAAVHGALMQGAGPPRRGMLGRLHTVRPGCDWLDGVASALTIRATVLHRDPAGGIYAFEAHGDGALLLQGRLTVAYTGGAPAGTP